jgi:hypothetical protein
MPKSRKLNERKLRQLRAEAIEMTQRHQRSPLVTRQQVLLARVVWFTIRRHGFTPVNLLEGRAGFKFCMNPQWLDGPNMVELEYYRKDRDVDRCSEAMERIQDCLRDALLPVLGPDNTELIIRVTRFGNSKKNPKPIAIIAVLCPPQDLLEALYRRTFPHSA